MSRNVIKLLSLLEENLVEYGDLKNIKPYVLKRKSSLLYQFNSEQGSTVDVKFTKLNSDEIELIKIPSIINREKISGYFNVGYTVDNSTTQGKKSNINELLRIMKTIVNIIHKFLNGNENAAIVVFEENKKPELGYSTGQKSLLYHTIINQNLPHGYTSREVSISNIQGLIIAPE